MKVSLTPETAINTFVKCKKEGKQIPEEVLESIKGYKKWGENQLKGLLNASAYYPEILLENGMEDTILQLLKKFKERIVPTKK